MGRRPLESNGTFWDSVPNVEFFLWDKRNGPDHPERVFMREYIRENYPENATLLDIPSGAGVDYFILREVANVTVADKTQAMLDTVKNKFPGVENKLLDIRLMDKLPDNSFDVVYARAIFEHLPTITDVAMAMQECFRVAKKEVLYSFYLPFAQKTEINFNGNFFENKYTAENINVILADIPYEQKTVHEIPPSADFDGVYTIISLTK